jgi:hypothetical protein
MREIPLVFPLSFAVLLVVIFFTSAFAIADGAVTREGESAETAAEYEWYESTAIYVCPLH